MRVIAADFLVQPGIGMIIWFVIATVALPSAVVTAAKGRWGWFLIGLLTLIGFIFGAFQSPAEGSLWTRLRPGSRPR